MHQQLVRTLVWRSWSRGRTQQLFCQSSLFDVCDDCSMTTWSSPATFEHVVATGGEEALERAKSSKGHGLKWT